MDILHPVHVGLCEALGNELYPAVLDDIDGRLGKGLHLHKPLGARERLNNRAAAVAAADIVVIRLYLDKVSLLLEIGNDGLAGFVAIHAVILAAVYYLCILIDDEYLLKVMAQSDLVVIGVVAGGHLDSARAEAELNIVVGDDGELSADKGQNCVFADKVLIALIVGVNGNTGVAEHGLGTGGCDYKLLIRVLDGVSYMPEAAGHVLVLDLGIRQSRAALGAPVDDSVALIDKSLFVQLTEGLAHGLGSCLIHGECASVPIAGRTEHLLLLDYAVTVFVFPIPNTLKELLTAEVVAGKSLLLAQLLLDLYLCRNARVVGAGEPKGCIALHSLIAGEDILQSGVKSMTHVELTCYIGGRHDDGKRLFVGVDNALEVTAGLPHIINSLFDRTRVIHLG